MAYKFSGYVENTVIKTGVLMPYFTHDNNYYFQELSDDNTKITGFDLIEFEVFKKNSLDFKPAAEIKVEKGDNSIIVIRNREQIISGKYFDVISQLRQIFWKKLLDVEILNSIKELYNIDLSDIDKKQQINTFKKSRNNNFHEKSIPTQAYPIKRMSVVTIENARNNPNVNTAHFIEKKANIFKATGGSKANASSIEAQIAVLTERINYISAHMKINKKDFSTNRGLMQMVGRRRRLLQYLSHNNLESYRGLIEKLGLRK